MPRSNRIDLPFSLYHVHSRTSAGELAFAHHQDRERFLAGMARYAVLFGFRIHAWCLIADHFHLLVESTEQPCLSEFMRRLLTAFTISYNHRHKRHGHLFQARFRSLLVDKARFLAAMSHYIHNNPRRVAGRTNPETYDGSSLRFFLNGGEPSFLDTSEVLSLFKNDRKRYQDYVKSDLSENARPQVLQQLFIGDETYAARMGALVDAVSHSGSPDSEKMRKIRERKEREEEKRAEEIVRAVARRFKMTARMLLNIRYGRGDLRRARFVLVVLLRENLTWTSSRIAQYLGLNERNGVHYYIKAVKADPDLHALYEEVSAEIAS